MWIESQRAINRLASGFEIARHLIIEEEILERPGRVRVQADGFLKVRGGSRPAALPPLDGADREINIRVVRQSLLGKTELPKCGLEIMLTIIKSETAGEMALRQIGLQFQCALCQSPRFVAQRGCWIVAVVNPALELRIGREGEREAR